VAVTLAAQAVDPRVILAWKQALTVLDDEPLQAYMAPHPRLTAGFRKGKINKAVALTRVQALLDRSGELPADLRDLLRGCTLSMPLLSILSEQAIAAAMPALAQAMGSLRIYAALLLDDRAAVRDRGFDQLAGWDGLEPTAVGQSEALAALLKTFKPFVDQIRPWVTALEKPTEPVAEVRSLGQARQRDSKTLSQVLELREKRKEANQLRRQLAQSGVEAGLAQQRAQAMTTELVATLSLLASRVDDHVDLSDQFEDRVTQELGRRMDARLLPWLQPVESLAQATAAELQSDDLLMGAEALLQRQALVDRKFGLRSQLKARLLQYRTMVVQLNAALLESIRPLPEIGAMVQRIERHIAQLEKTLGQGSVLAAHAVRPPHELVRRLQQARTLDDIADFRIALQASAALGLLASSEMQAAYQSIDETTSRLYLQACADRSWQADPSQLRALPLRALQAQLAQQRDCALLVDGHNVLYGLPELFAAHYEKGHPGLRARQHLISRLDSLSQLHPMLAVDLWFDGEAATDQNQGRNFRVRYSGGKGANRADAQIVAHLQYLGGATPDQFCVVVTADREVAVAAEGCGALIIAPQELALLMA
jgi:predicted RNA-binding protein with PIN domain